jgi:hypothetical protein
LAGFEPAGAESGDTSLAGFAGGRRPPRARKPDSNARGFQIGRRRLSPNFGFFLDAPQRPAQSPQRNDLLLFLFVQDIHINGG